jgi:glyoxylase I family protein
MSSALRIHHVAIICSDYARSRHFYTEVLGLPVIREIYREERNSWKCDLDAGNAQIELFSFPTPPPRPSYPEACGLRHLALATDDLAAQVARLTALGIAVEPIRIDPYTDRAFTFFADPDGLPIEFYEVTQAPSLSQAR